MGNTETGMRNGIAGARGSSSDVRRSARFALALTGLVWSLAACGSPEPITADDGHIDLVIGASEPGGGELVADYDFELPLEVFRSATIGGFTLWSGADPGFANAEFDDPSEGFYALADGVTVSLEVTALEAGMQFRFGEVTVNEVGESVVLGTAPDLHGHGEWQVALPEGVSTGQYPFSFRFIADSTYTPSQQETALMTPIPGESDPGHDDEHGDDDHDDDDHDDDHDDDDHGDEE